MILFLLTAPLAVGFDDQPLYACDLIIIPCQISRYYLDGLVDLLTTLEHVKALKPRVIQR